MHLKSDWKQVRWNAFSFMDCSVGRCVFKLKWAHRAQTKQTHFNNCNLQLLAIVHTRWMVLIHWSISSLMLNIANELERTISKANKSDADRMYWRWTEAWLNVMQSSLKCIWNEKSLTFFIDSKMFQQINSILTLYIYRKIDHPFTFFFRSSV